MTPALPKAEARKEAFLDWRSRANCIGVDPELFFPISSTGLGRMQAQAAKQICGACPVANDCARWALRQGELYGIWGGLDEEDRRAARRAVWRSRGESACETSLSHRSEVDVGGGGAPGQAGGTAVVPPAAPEARATR